MAKRTVTKSAPRRQKAAKPARGVRITSSDVQPKKAVSVPTTPTPEERPLLDVPGFDEAYAACQSAYELVGHKTRLWALEQVRDTYTCAWPSVDANRLNELVRLENEREAEPHAMVTEADADELRAWIKIAVDGIHRGLAGYSRGPTVQVVEEPGEMLLALNALWKLDDLLGTITDEAAGKGGAS